MSRLSPSVSEVGAGPGVWHPHGLVLSWVDFIYFSGVWDRERGAERLPPAGSEPCVGLGPGLKRRQGEGLAGGARALLSR